MTVAAVSAFIGCNDGPFSPEIRSISVTAGFSSEDGGTKALLEPSQLLTSGTEVMFYGLATDNSTASAKDIPGHTSGGDGTTKLNDGQTITYNGTGWPYNSGEDYQWLPKADFRFFGWLAKDAVSSLTASGFFGTGFSFNPSTGVLSIPSKTMTITDGSLDFAYSDVVARSASEADYSTVELTLKHLFTSFSVSAHNYTSSPIVIKSVKLFGIRNQKSATVSFGTTGSSATYSVGSTVYGGSNTSFELVSEGSGISLSADAQKANIINGASDKKRYILMWPQTAEELTAASSSTAEFIPSGTNPAYMQVVYSQNGGADMTVNVRIPFDDGIGWAAGTRHNIELAFFEKLMLLNVYAANWNETDPVISYDGPIAVTDAGKLKVASDCNCVKSDDGKTIYFKPGFPIILEFKVDQPLNATWLVSKKGDFDAFDIDNSDDPSAKMGDDNDTAEGLIVSGNTARITIYPRIEDMQKSEYKLQLSFFVRLNNGEMTNIDELIYDDESPMTFILLKD